ncbi:MAG TPA: class I SAM-dependent methyltransferase [Myxococcota bacterium]|nr:class I SAM-dependent methyltransferase [Myxococcota bacterium]
MRNAVIADRADRILARLFPTRFRAAAPEGRHGRVGAPHLWRMQRAFQIDFLQRMGLAKEHQLLDLGCGTLRGGLPLIAYLSAGNYTGIDVRAEIVDEAMRELEEACLEQRYPRICLVDSLADLDLNASYDFIWAFSVLLHLEDPELETALAFAARHLRAEGSFYANVHLGDGRLGTWAGYPVVARPLDWYRARAHEAGLTADSLGRLCALGHLSGDRNSDSQFMLCFRKAR